MNLVIYCALARVWELFLTLCLPEGHAPSWPKQWDKRTRRSASLRLSNTILLAGVLTSHSVSAGNTAAQRVLVVYNENEPASKPLATYYAEKRGIPADHLCGLHIRNVEAITRREFEKQIREPLRQFIADHHLLVKIAGETVDNKLDYLALVYGVPLRIEEDRTIKEVIPTNMPAPYRRNDAAVDSELATLPGPAMPLIGWLRNPFFDAPSPHFEAPWNNTMILVARLDGPDPATVRRMIDDAIATEKYGLLGRCYFDARNTAEPGYQAGDRWIQEAYRAFQAAGYECELENTEAVFAEKFPMSDAAVYAGWYAGNVTGPFQRANFQFRRGAVAYHLHSASATTLRTRTAFWVGPLLAKGAAVSFGNVREPYLDLTPHLDVFFRRLLAGATFAEAGWASQVGLSWQTTFVGDPLYRPFSVPLDEQLDLLEQDHHPDREWAYIRKVNRLIAHGEGRTAEQLCCDKAAALQSAPLYEKLGDLLSGDQRAAAYQRALELAGDPSRSERLTQKLAGAAQAQ